MLLLSFSSKKCFPLYSDAWKVICHSQMISLHSSFLLKSHNDLHGKLRSILSHLVSLLTAKWEGHSALLGQSQKAMKLLEFMLKKTLRSWDTAIECNWYGWKGELNMCLAAWIAPVITMMCLTFETCITWFILHLIANNSASVEVTLTVWWVIHVFYSWTPDLPCMSSVHCLLLVFFIRV